jgi:penicillin amidase
MRPAPKRIVLALGAFLLLVLVAATAGGLWLRSRVRASLPRLTGDVVLAGLSAPVDVERDALGVPLIRGANRVDVACATGFVHAPERWFQMDLLRRRPAGELAELFGPRAKDADRGVRLHRFRAAARAALARATAAERELLDAYARGANAGLESLGAAPPEYLLLRVEPVPWQPEDSLLVVLALYLQLQEDGFAIESRIGVMREELPPALVDFLLPTSSEWDAPLIGQAHPSPRIPPADVLDLRGLDPPTLDASASRPSWLEPELAGSNAWAVAGAHTADGGALLANDMHLGHGMPNIWYRATLAWSEAEPQRGERRVTGVTLPGTPAMVAGSNGHVAWGFTNTHGDWSDLVLLETASDDDEVYLTSDGPRRFTHFEERLAVKGEPGEVLDVPWTIWGPVFDRDPRGRRRALRWVAHDPRGADLKLIEMERAESVEAALDIAARAGIPAQNLIVADRAGHVGWTIMGPLPRRFGQAGRWPVSWADGSSGWDGYLPASDYPRLAGPEVGRVWTANNRVIAASMPGAIPDGGFDLGARASQIRDGLHRLARATPRDLLALQLDDRARLLDRWRGLALATLDARPPREDSLLAVFQKLVREDWNGHASVKSVGYRLVREFRLHVARQVLDAITAPCRAADPTFRYPGGGNWEAPVWRLVTERPPHLLAPGFADWNEQLLAAVQAVIDTLLADPHDRLDERSWGERNTVALRHPLSGALPGLASLLDIEGRALPGDSGMPRVQGPTFGASERMVVSPGREEGGLFHMPGGQSGHPLSPFYRAGHEAWARGEPLPLLPGPAAWRLRLVPAGPRAR